MGAVVDPFVVGAVVAPFVVGAVVGAVVAPFVVGAVVAAFVVGAVVGAFVVGMAVGAAVGAFVVGFADGATEGALVADPGTVGRGIGVVLSDAYELVIYTELATPLANAVVEACSFSISFVPTSYHSTPPIRGNWEGIALNISVIHCA